MPNPLDPLERSINSFIQQANEYHQFRIAGPEAGVSDDQFSGQLKSKWFALEQAQRKISCQAWIEYDIALGLEDRNNNPDYKDKTDDEIEDMMLEEKHHPTTVLRENMLKAGKPAPDGRCSCHHIAEGQGKVRNRLNGKVVQNFVVVNTRVILHSVGIGINDAGNGVWLPMYMKYVPHPAMPKALPHANIHTLAYEQHVFERLRDTPRTELEIRTELSVLAKELQTAKERHFLTKKSNQAFAKALHQKQKRFA